MHGGPFNSFFKCCFILLEVFRENSKEKLYRKTSTIKTFQFHCQIAGIDVIAMALGLKQRQTNLQII